MRYLLNNKVYDTEKAQKIIKYRQSIEHKGLFGYSSYPKYQHTLYKTNKGQFFVHIGKYIGNTDISYIDRDYIELLTDEEVKIILNELNDVEKYTELFDDIEEG